MEFFQLKLEKISEWWDTRGKKLLLVAANAATFA
jgi:hypothetical protein